MAFPSRLQFLSQKVFVNAVPCSKNQPVSIGIVNGKAIALPYKSKRQLPDKPQFDVIVSEKNF